MSMSSANHRHRGGGHSQHSSSSRSIHSQVNDVVSVTRDRFNDVVSSMQNRQGIEQSSQSPSSSRVVNLVGLRDGLDALVKVMFAPCVSLDIGGVPRGEMPTGGGDARATSARRAVASAGSGGGRGTVAAFGTPVTPPWGASIPFEVSASMSNLSQSLVHTPSSLQELVPSSTPSWSSSQVPRQQRQRHQRHRVHPPPTTPTARERRMAESHARLRQLGARHQLACGFTGESLADTARPLEPADDARRDPASLELVDFDDGISAISSYTLEEMERRIAVKERGGGGGRAVVMMKVNPHDFSQVSEEVCEWGGRDAVHGGGGGGWRQWGGDRLDLVEEDEEKNTEVVFGEPFYEEGAKDATAARINNVCHLHEKTDVNRVPSNQTNLTMNTTGTDSSNSFEDLYRRQETLYWQDQDRVADVEHGSRGLTHGNGGRDASRSSHCMSIEERARRLREISRSMSDGSSCSFSSKSGTSSSLGSHPHDTLPINSSDNFRMRQSNPPKHTQSRITNTSGIHRSVCPRRLEDNEI